MNAVDIFAPPAAVVAIIRHHFHETDYRLDEIAEEVGSKLFPEAWAKLVQEVGKRTALDVTGALVLRAIERTAERLKKEAKLAEFGAAQQRACAAALREELTALNLAGAFGLRTIERLEEQAKFAESEAKQRRALAAALRKKLNRGEPKLS
jgi:hypothetical protein